jgi:pyridoxal phosphate enzyme (YggS family)
VETRREELAANLAAVERRLSAACAAAGRGRGEVTLVAVTKTFPASDVRLLGELGVTDVAENRDQEARAKAAEGGPGLRWHFVGQLQRNKCRSVARYADVVHSVDRPELVGALARAAQHRAAPLDVLIQVDLDPEPAGTRGGVRPDRVTVLADLVAAESTLRLRGVMAVAPLGGDPGAAFAHLSALSGTLRASYPGAVWISAGMSGDLESAIRHGATHVRVGSALLGSR